MSKHTKEPWNIFAFEIYDEREQIIADCGYSEDVFTQDGCIANAQRIVQCVNAMDGIENPEEYMNAMREVHDTLATTREKLEQSHNDNAVLTDLLLRIAQRLDASNIEILQDINDTLEGLKR